MLPRSNTEFTGEFMSHVVDRLLRYVKVNTRSDLNSKASPSTPEQFDLARLLVDEMKSIGIKDAELDEHCYIYGTIPATTDKKVPTLGFIAHMDTSSEISGENVKPQQIESYDGKDIALNPMTILSPKEFPELLKYIGQPLITTDGTTLLGADDKAGIAIIMTMAETLLAHPEIQHGRIRIGFTPDEEVSRGTEYFDVKKFNADYAYTLDGGELGELEYECFNAAIARVHIQGRSVHPGSAKDQMINALELAIRFNSQLPPAEKPEYTQGYEGFYHMIELKGEVEEAALVYILRDHDRQKFETKKKVFQKAADYLNFILGSNRITVDIKDQYQNMKEVIMPSFHVVTTARVAMEQVGVKPKIGPIRGGTDGAQLSYQGLPTPNIFTGGHNFHGKYEYLPPKSLEKALEVVLKIVELYTVHPEGIE
jgi:tripeptide aminopeptidase